MLSIPTMATELPSAVFILEITYISLLSLQFIASGKQKSGNIDAFYLLPGTVTPHHCV